jgi:ribonuclease HI
MKPPAVVEFLQNPGEIKDITMVSDGSVRDSKYRGTWAWSLVKFDDQGAFLGGVHSVGCDTMTDENLLTDEKHSYRMEALALLDGLTYMKNRITWEGTIHWHTDSESVIKT